MKNYIYTAIISAAIGAALVAMLKKPEVKTEIKEVVKTQVVTKTKIVKQPDGTTVTEIDSETNIDKKTDLKTEPAKKDWNIAVYTYGPANYGIAVQRRIVGDFTAYVSGQSNGQIAVGVGFNF